MSAARRALLKTASVAAVLLAAVLTLSATALWTSAASAQTALVDPAAPSPPQALDAPALDALGLAEQTARSRVDMVFLGEIHDNPTHHRVQAEIVAALAAQGGVAALVFEMIGAAEEEPVNDLRGWPGGAVGAEPAVLAAIAEALDWANSGWPDWAFYAPIFAAAPQAFVAGAELPRDALRPLMRGDVAGALTAAPGAARFGLDQPLDPAEQAAREAGQIAAHCDMIPAEVAGPMVAAQRLRDAALAEAALRARDRAAAAGRSGVVVVITGAGHARRDHGAPRMLRRADPALTVLSIGLVERAPAAPPLDLAALAPQFDLIGEAAPPDPPREDPCLAFRRSRE